MIQPPRKAVTRFFVPLIDVLILLFCMFLLLPIVSKPDGEKAEKPNEPQPDLKEWEQRAILAEAQVKTLMDERAKVAERTVLAILEVDPRDGKLFYFDKPAPGTNEQPKRIPVSDEAEVQAFIDRQRQVARGPVRFLILMPRELSGFPTGPQRTAYRDWFERRKVPYTIDDPFSAK